jgi:hypothetical protein
MPVSYWNFSTSIDRIARYVSGQKKQKKERNGRKESDTYWFGRVVTAGEWSESSSLFLLASPRPRRRSAQLDAELVGAPPEQSQTIDHSSC